MPLPEENADEPPYAQKDGTASYKNTPLSKLPSILTFGSEPFIQQTLFKRGTDCIFLIFLTTRTFIRFQRVQVAQNMPEEIQH